MWAANISSPRPGLRLCSSVSGVGCWAGGAMGVRNLTTQTETENSGTITGVGPSNSSAEKETNQRAEGSLDEALTISNCISINNSCVKDSL